MCTWFWVCRNTGPRIAHANVQPVKKSPSRSIRTEFTCAKTQKILHFILLFSFPIWNRFVFMSFRRTSGELNADGNRVISVCVRRKNLFIYIFLGKRQQMTVLCLAFFFPHFSFIIVFTIFRATHKFPEFVENLFSFRSFGYIFFSVLMLRLLWFDEK